MPRYTPPSTRSTKTPLLHCTLPRICFISFFRAGLRAFQESKSWRNLILHVLDECRTSAGLDADFFLFVVLQGLDAGTVLFCLPTIKTLIIVFYRANYDSLFFSIPRSSYFFRDNLIDE